MIRPEIYAKTNHMQREVVQGVLEKYLCKLSIAKNTSIKLNVLDIGCGTGDVMIDLLLPRLPLNLLNLVGCDVSAESIQYSKEKYQMSNNKIKFDILDITTDTLPQKYKEHFHYVFSFFCLHWVNQSKAFGNIKKMLKFNGEAFLCFPLSNCVIRSLQILSKTEKWALHTPSSLVAQLQLATEIEAEDVFKHIQNVGLIVKEYHVQEVNYKYANMEEFKHAFVPLVPTLTHLNEQLQETYMSDFVQECQNLKYLKISTSNEAIFTYKCMTLLVDNY